MTLCVKCQLIWKKKIALSDGPCKCDSWMGRHWNLVFLIINNAKEVGTHKMRQGVTFFCSVRVLNLHNFHCQKIVVIGTPTKRTRTSTSNHMKWNVCGFRNPHRWGASHRPGEDHHESHEGGHGKNITMMIVMIERSYILGPPWTFLGLGACVK